jgi:uncharacterized membrane protein
MTDTTLHDPGANGKPQFHAVIRPHRSLSDMAFESWVLGFLVIGLAMSLTANSLGYPPIGFFLGLDAILISSMFVAWRCAQDRREEIFLDGSTLMICRFRKDILVDQRRFFADCLDIERNDDPDYGCLSLRISRKSASFPIACDLSPAERDAFADALCDALRAAGHLPIVRIKKSPALEQ